MDQYDIFDMTEENKPQKSFSSRTKKMLKYGLSIAIGLVIAGIAILIYNLAVNHSGADTPEAAVSSYLKASNAYDIDEMIKYSSTYNKTVLYGLRIPESDDDLREYLAMKDTNDEIKEFSSTVHSARIYEKGDAMYDKIINMYAERVPDGISDIEKAAVVNLSYTYGTRNSKAKDYFAIYEDSRWYYVEGTVQSESDTLKDAVAEYIKAGILYDIDGIIQYSSEYNRIILNGGTAPESIDALKMYMLSNAPSTDVNLEKDDITAVCIGNNYHIYEPANSQFKEYLAPYFEKLPEAQSSIKKVAVIRMTVEINGASFDVSDYVAVYYDGKWTVAYTVE